MTLAEQIAEYQALKAAERAANKAAVDARHAEYVAGQALTTAMLAAIPRDKALNRVLTVAGEEVLVQRLTVPSHEGDVVRPSVSRRIKSGAWGKSWHVANMVRWDFEAGDWKAEG